MEKRLLAVAASLTRLINNKVLGGIAVCFLAIIIDSYFLDRMETLTPYLTDLKPIFQTIAISLILLVAIGAVCYSIYHLFRKKP